MRHTVVLQLALDSNNWTAFQNCLKESEGLVMAQFSSGKYLKGALSFVAHFQGDSCRGKRADILQIKRNLLGR